MESFEQITNLLTINDKIRMYEKSKITMYKHTFLFYHLYLVKCGLSLDNARGLAYCRRGYTFVAHSQILQMAISKERLQKPNNNLKRRGLFFALDYYLA